jgi:hypothetical protein
MTTTDGPGRAGSGRSRVSGEPSRHPPGKAAAVVALVTLAVLALAVLSTVGH